MLFPRLPLASFVTLDESFSAVSSIRAYDVARDSQRGRYQRALIAGREAFSGSSLQGKSATYRGRYFASALSALARARAAGLALSVERIGKRNILCIVDPRDVGRPSGVAVCPLTGAPI